MLATSWLEAYDKHDPATDPKDLATAASLVLVRGREGPFFSLLKAQVLDASRWTEAQERLQADEPGLSSCISCCREPGRLTLADACNTMQTWDYANDDGMRINLNLEQA